MKRREFIGATGSLAVLPVFPVLPDKTSAMNIEDLLHDLVACTPLGEEPDVLRTGFRHVDLSVPLSVCQIKNAYRDLSSGVICPHFINCAMHLQGKMYGACGLAEVDGKSAKIESYAVTVPHSWGPKMFFGWL